MFALLRGLSFARLITVMRKEFIQLRRDRLTFAMMVGIPIIQLTLFGYAINGDPKHLPIVVVAEEQSAFARSLTAALTVSDYFDILSTSATQADADRMLAEGSAQFALVIPPDFSRKLIRGERAQVLLDADATDPTATGNAIAALNQLAPGALARDLGGPLASHAAAPPPFDVVVQRRYNPDGLTAWNVVPGLMGVILTMTMIMMTGLALTREVERGTMENLLATPVRPVEVMVGKILPFILIGFVQVVLILIAARLLFNVPFIGTKPVLLLGVLVFIAANLVVGITISSVARNQMQAMQMTFFFFLPSILLSGFMFPFRGMPGWAQFIGEALPLTHFLRLARGVMLKGNGVVEIWPHLWPLLLFITVVLAIGLKRFRKTLD
ncbi:ABC transporter permease [Niveibacterium sp. COAC-50]|uniref:ABC transporter permease n=1 Tax=Niveibacterium sp. COAC-50 TaxID=2729384 RepID=UPI0015574F48|nr:ABC transporter permease [Niveibacterium sp. COAC-50]